MITFMIDEFTLCLKDCETGEIFHTEVIELTPADVRKTKKPWADFQNCHSRVIIRINRRKLKQSK